MRKVKVVELTPKANEMIMANDFIVVPNESIGEQLIELDPVPPQLEGKIIIVAPEGLMSVSVELLEDLIREKNRTASPLLLPSKKKQIVS